MEQDNSTTQTQDNSQAQDQGSSATTTTQTTSTGWKSGLSKDLQSSPLIQKFEDTPDGFNKAFESHANLEKLLGHEKVPIPKDINDVEGWNRFSKAMGIPDKADGYGLADFKMPDTMKQYAIDKNKFTEVVHAHKLTPDQAKGLWKVYNEINIETYNKATEARQKQLTETVNRLKGEWGDAYDMNVELGQTVINKFSDDQDMNDYITAALSQDPRGIKFLAKIGDQFAENKVGEFQMKKFSKTPDEIRNEIAKIKSDLNHPYWGKKGSPQEQQAAIDYVNHLTGLLVKGQGKA